MSAVEKGVFYLVQGKTSLSKWEDVSRHKSLAAAERAAEREAHGLGYSNWPARVVRCEVIQVIA